MIAGGVTVWMVMAGLWAVDACVCGHLVHDDALIRHLLWGITCTHTNGHFILMFTVFTVLG
jgi:hypothetical protein